MNTENTQTRKEELAEKITRLTKQISHHHGVLEKVQPNRWFDQSRRNLADSELELQQLQEEFNNL
jgi:phenylpyruvate tautomerase PptA (4-oxalocrotonate tautomerase family)